MRNLVSGVVGLVLGSLCLLSMLVQGGPQGQGGYFVGQLLALIMGLLFFFGGIGYLVMGVIQVQAEGGKKRRRRPTDDYDDDDDDRPRRKRRSRDDDDDDDEVDDRPRKKRRSRNEDDD